MNVVLASLGTEQIKIESKNANLLGSGITPFIREQLLDVLETYAAKASVNHASLKIGDTLIETGVLPAMGRPLKSELNGDFASAVQQKIETLLSDYMENAAAIDYTAFRGAGTRQPSVAVQRPAPGFDPKLIPNF